MAEREYLESRHRGGRNFAKGGQFEDRVAIVKLAQALDHFMNTGTGFRAVAQSPAHFVDDLVIYRDNHGEFCHQMKDTTRLTWGNGKPNSLVFDFHHEARKHRSASVSLSLIVSTSAIATKLHKQLPRQLRNRVTVEFIPNIQLHGLIAKPAFRKFFAAIGKWPSPSDAQLLSLAKNLLADWKEAGEKGAEPNVFLTGEAKSLLWKNVTMNSVKSELQSILNSIPNLLWQIHQGYLSYECMNMKQTLAFDCESPQFRAMEKEIIERQPTSFEELESLLMIGSETSHG